MYNEYFVHDKVSRSKITSHIKQRKLERNDIEKLIEMPEVQSAFFGTTYKNKCSKKEWNRRYLERLANVGVAESFNRDYLLYLDEVADFISKATYKKIVVAGVIIVIVIIAGVIVYKYALPLQ